TQHGAQHRGVAVAGLGLNTFAGTGVHRPSGELGFERPGFSQILRALELQTPGFTRLAFEIEDSRATAYQSVAHAAVDIETVLVEGLNLVGTGLQMQALVRSAKHGVGSRVWLAVDTADFQFAGNHQRQYLALR